MKWNGHVTCFCALSARSCTLGKVAERPIICRPPPEILESYYKQQQISRFHIISAYLGPRILLISSDYLWLSMVISKYWNTIHVIKFINIYQHYMTPKAEERTLRRGCLAQAPCFNASCASAVSSDIAVLNLLVHNITSCQTGQIQCLEQVRLTWHSISTWSKSTLASSHGAPFGCQFRVLHNPV